MFLLKYFKCFLIIQCMHLLCTHYKVNFYCTMHYFGHKYLRCKMWQSGCFSQIRSHYTDWATARPPATICSTISGSWLYCLQISAPQNVMAQPPCVQCLALCCSDQCLCYRVKVSNLKPFLTQAYPSIAAISHEVIYGANVHNVLLAQQNYLNWNEIWVKL